jgi:hypothetical protein
MQGKMLLGRTLLGNGRRLLDESKLVESKLVESKLFESRMTFPEQHVAPMYRPFWEQLSLAPAATAEGTRGSFQPLPPGHLASVCRRCGPHGMGRVDRPYWRQNRYKQRCGPPLNRMWKTDAAIWRPCLVGASYVSGWSLWMGDSCPPCNK